MSNMGQNRMWQVRCSSGEASPSCFRKRRAPIAVLAPSFSTEHNFVILGSFLLAASGDNMHQNDSVLTVVSIDREGAM